MGVIASISIFISIASKREISVGKWPGTRTGSWPRCLNPEVINGRIVIISDQRTISRGPGTHFIFTWLQLTKKWAEWGHGAQRAQRRDFIVTSGFNLVAF